MSFDDVKNRLLSIGLKPRGFKEYWGREIERLLQDYEKIEKTQDSEVLLSGIIKTSLDSMVKSDPRISFAPKFQVKILDGHIAIKFDQDDLKRLEDNWNKFVR